MSFYVKVVGPGARERVEKRKLVPRLIAEGYVECGTKDGYECYVFDEKLAKTKATNSKSGQAIHARADQSCRIYSPGQLMGNLYELAGLW